MVTIEGKNKKSNFEELEALSISAGANVVFEIKVRSEKINSGFFVGSGKLDEIKKNCLIHETSLVIFGQELTPIQQRNLTRYLNCRVIDRVALILDIFALRANSHEGKIQVELAQLEYISSRLVRGWTHLERQKGGIGLRGPGETQLESDRRLISLKVKKLKQKLENLSIQRKNRRRAREKSGALNVSLVGYTNAGKSTLFNKLTNSNVLAADQLFATLDTTSRKVYLEKKNYMILSDTVGFINQLPHNLIEAFKATLQEAVLADILVHVVDYSNANWRDQMKDVELVLKEVNADKIPRVNFFNKIDCMSLKPRVEHDQCGRIKNIWSSAKKNLGLGFLKKAVLSHVLYNVNLNKTEELESRKYNKDFFDNNKTSPSSKSLL